ncbi:MAG: conjugal transfer protein TraR [Candidatus Moraniibacteriota bacterium]|nr:MAG: conjugal transfer protein TraR [Candidatus Moranbacteria bacterium]
METLVFWIAIFVISLFVMLKGADWFLVSSEKIGRALGLSAFIIGAVIVGLGTSLPELAVALFALVQGAEDVIVSNAVGSNISNILLIIGIAAIVARKLVVSKNLIDIDLPMLASSTAIFLVVTWNQEVSFAEALILIGAYTIYFAYTIFSKDVGIDNEDETVHKKERITLRLIGMLVLSGIALVFGAKYLINSVVSIAEILDVQSALISITAVAVGTSLPELIVSIKAALSGKSEIAVGNIFGSNTFNALMVVGVPALFSNLHVDPMTFQIGLPIMAVATFLFLFSGISRKIYLWEGAMFTLLYIYFIGRLFYIF